MPNADPLYPHYKRARNRIKKCEPLSMASHLIECLHKAHIGGVQVIRTHQPWHILIALKWTFQEMDGLCHRRPRAEFDDARRVLHVMHEADDSVLSRFSHLTLFLRQKAFQQFWIYPTRTVPHWLGKRSCSEASRQTMVSRASSSLSRECRSRNTSNLRSGLWLWC